MKSFHMYTIAATGGRFRPTPITVLLERGEGFFRVESFPHFGKQQIKRRNTSASNIQADADRCKQTQMDRPTVSLVDVTHSLDNNISPHKFIWLVPFNLFQFGPCASTLLY